VTTSCRESVLSRHMRLPFRPILIRFWLHFDFLVALAC
jgi:hypothetical protein